ncbi:MAG: hypothetical protein HYY48_01835 [Gammaproteobacteria bacterium]|nr:hypothetical protein [Gammaproteobacteria bacterium]
MRIDAAALCRALIRPAVDLVRNIIAGFRLALFLPVGQWHFRLSISQAVLLGILSFGFNFSYDFLVTWPEHTFNTDGLNYQASLYLLFLLSIVLIAAAFRAFQGIVALLVMILSITPTTFIIYSAVHWALQWQGAIAPEIAYEAVLAAYLAWYLAIVLRVFRKVLRPRLWGGAAAFAFYILFNIVPWFLLPNTPLWIAEVSTEGIPRVVRAPDLEDLFLRQPRLMDAAATAVQSQRPETIDLYFIGVAGYGDEDVFMNEAQAARRLFDERFDTRGRSMLLVNNEKTLAAVPVASIRNLRSALSLVGRRMDPQEDVLAVFLTSHGDEDAGLSLDAGFYEFDSLTPAALRDLLSEAGVRWRVIIVSSCYSGGFIGALRDPSTLIITSSRADRNSFGCGHDGDFTYFGQAFIGESLRSDLSFVTAFERARAGIRDRERQEGLTPSEPQISVGAEIGPLLDRLVEQLKAGRLETPAENSRAFARVEKAARLKYGAIELVISDANTTFEHQVEQ